MPETHRALDWLARRHAGESAAYIAHNAGVSEQAVLRATRDYGPFPRPTQQLGRVTISDELIDARALRWVKVRRRGVPVKEIAAAHGVTHQFVSRTTKDHGPFPAREVVDDWASQRHQGRPVLAIAEAAGLAPGVIRRHTASQGPCRASGPKLPDGVMGISGVASRLGLLGPSVSRWLATNRLPEPDFVTARARVLWLDTTIDPWLDELDLERCPDCGARCLSPSRHRSASHRRTAFLLTEQDKF